MKKRFVCLIAAILLFLTNIASAEGITVFINGNELDAPLAPQLVNDRTMFPMRAIFESLGANVQWFEKDEIIFATKGDTLITLKIGSYEMVLQRVTSEKPEIINLDVAPYIVDDHTLVPVRAVAEALKANVEWIDETQQVIITTK